MNFENLKEFKKIEAVYGIKNIITNKWYIGSTFNLHDRIRRHRYALLTHTHHSSKLQRSFDKYGINNFEVFIIESFKNLDIDDLINKEIDYINQYDSLNNGYNMTKDCRIYKQFKLSKEAINKVAAKNNKAVIQFDLNGNYIKKFNSITEAATELNEQTTNISKACKLGVSHSVKNFIFIYEKDYDETKDYSYKKYKPTKEHVEKLRNLSKCNKRVRKITEFDKDNNVLQVFPNISELERELNLKKDTLRIYYKQSKAKTKFEVKNRFFEIEQSYSYKDIV